jgi:hypothetical protein
VPGRVDERARDRGVARRRGELDALGIGATLDRERPGRGLGERGDILALLGDPLVAGATTRSCVATRARTTPAAIATAQPATRPIPTVRRRRAASIRRAPGQRGRRRLDGRGGGDAACSGDGRRARRAPIDADRGHEGERPLAEIRWRRGPDGVADHRRRPPQSLELERTFQAAREMAREGRRVCRVACREPIEAVRLDRRKFEELSRLSVFHLSRHRSIFSPAGTATGASSAAGPSSSLSTSRSRINARRVRVFTVPERPAQPLRDLGLGQLRAVRQDERRPLDARQLAPAPRESPRAAPLPRARLRARSQVRPAQDRAAGGDPFERRRVVLVVPAADDSGTRLGRRPAARSRSTVRLRAIV